MSSLEDNRGKATNIFFELYTSFKQKFSEIKELQDTKDNMLKTNADHVNLQRARFQIKNGIVSLKDYIKKMEKSISLIKDKNADFNTNELSETVDRCNRLVDVLERKELSNGPRSTSMAATSGRSALNRDEQMLLENWEDQMHEIVGLSGRSS